MLRSIGCVAISRPARCTEVMHACMHSSAHKNCGWQVLTRVRGIEDVDEEFTDLIEACRLSNMVKHPWRNLFAPAYR